MKECFLKDGTSVQIRWVIRDDLAQVAEIEKASSAYPWSSDEITEMLRNRNCIGMILCPYDPKVGTTKGTQNILGFMIYELSKDRFRLLKLAVHPDHRHRGVATEMIKVLIRKLTHSRRQWIGVEVRETNLSAQIFFRNQGFFASDVYRKYFEDTGEDAYLMEYLVRFDDCDSSDGNDLQKGKSCKQR